MQDEHTALIGIASVFGLEILHRRMKSDIRNLNNLKRPFMVLKLLASIKIAKV